MYSGMHVQADQYAIQFCTEAEQLWTTEKDLDSVLNVAAALFLSLGYMGHGRDHSVLQYLQLAADMATRLGLFSGQQDMVRGVDVSHMSSDVASQHLYAAWGAFNWVT
jgi:uncharacterized protein YpiB (UPF0302 family)